VRSLFIVTEIALSLMLLVARRLAAEKFRPVARG
jgi:hypothetical protein